MSLSFTAGFICTIFALVGFSYGADSYCFRFTWLGPGFDNDTEIGNTTCEEKGFQPPCVEPLIFTFDGSEPDTNLMWELYDRDKFTCKLTRNTVCLKWVTFYDGMVENITYTCGKMNGPNGAEKDTCETMKGGAYRTTACACRTPVVNDGFRVPCNGSLRTSTSIWTCLFIMTSALLALRGTKLYLSSS